MVPISKGKQVAGVVVLAAIAYAASWALTPGQAAVPIESFTAEPGAPNIPVVAPPKEFALPSHDGTSRASKRVLSSPNGLFVSRYEPI